VIPTATGSEPGTGTVAPEPVLDTDPGTADGPLGLEPWRALALAVLRQAVLDAQGPRVSVQRAARVWFALRDHEFWLSVLGLPEAALDERLADLRPDPADLPRPRARPVLPPPPPPPPPQQPPRLPGPGPAQAPVAPVRQAPAAPLAMPGRFPLGCPVRLSASGQDQLGQYDRRGVYRRRAVVVGYGRDPRLLKVHIEGNKTAGTYAGSLWEPVAEEETHAP
jgi:hypothetical protein